ncbi:MAG TPA: hypothetical protein VNX67_02970 [Solirubrobacteraceae bacterium]|nr:hypothetical protein [Solirubrobacteraceae bacterium]
MSATRRISPFAVPSGVLFAVAPVPLLVFTRIVLFATPRRRTFASLSFAMRVVHSFMAASMFAGRRDLRFSGPGSLLFRVAWIGFFARGDLLFVAFGTLRFVGGHALLFVAPSTFFVAVSPFTGASAGLALFA